MHKRSSSGGLPVSRCQFRIVFGKTRNLYDISGTLPPATCSMYAEKAIPNFAHVGFSFKYGVAASNSPRELAIQTNHANSFSCRVSLRDALFSKERPSQ